MFDVGFWELFLILILALLVVGPERLPGAARSVGRWVGKTRRYVEGVRSEVEQEFDVTELKRVLHNQEIQINELQQQLHGDASGFINEGDHEQKQVSIEEEQHADQKDLPSNKES